MDLKMGSRLKGNESGHGVVGENVQGILTSFITLHIHSKNSSAERDVANMLKWSVAPTLERIED